MSEETEILMDVVLQTVILVLIAAAFTLAVINATSPDRFFMRYYGKDVGLVTESLFGANGEATISYALFDPLHTYNFTFTRQALLIQAPDGSTARQQYGTAAKPVIEETTLDGPLLISFYKTADNITFTPLATACDGASVVRSETMLYLTAPPAYDEPLQKAPLVQELTAVKLPKQNITLTIREGDAPKITSYASTSPALAARLACLLQRRLTTAFPDIGTDIDVAKHTGIAISLTVPKDLKPDQRATVIKAVLLGLEDFT